jgi:hypothetical protein
MDQIGRYRLWFVIALFVILVVVAALWLRGTLQDSGSSPLPTPLAAGESPLALPIPSPPFPTPRASWTGGGAALLWVALGVVLALGIAFFSLRRDRHTVE